MKAIQRVKYSSDPQDALQFNSVAKATLAGANHVLVRVVSASMNPVDVKLTAGWFASVKSEPLPRTIGFDAAGIVVEVGASVTRLKVGDRVFGDVGVDYQQTFAEFLSAPEAKFVVMPPSISFDEAASLPLAALSALDALNWAKVTPGCNYTVVVRGASSGVGTAGVQLARALGATKVIGISSRVELCKSLGCDEVINYKTEKWEDVLAGRNVDVFFDCVGGPEAWIGAQRVLKPNGAFATVAGDEQAAITIGRVVRLVAVVASRVFWSWTTSAPSYGFIMKNETQEKMAQLAQFVADGKLRAVLDADSPVEFSIVGAVAMAKKLNQGTAAGKLVMRIGRE